MAISIAPIESASDHMYPICTGQMMFSLPLPKKPSHTIAARLHSQRIPARWMTTPTIQVTAT